MLAFSIFFLKSLHVCKLSKSMNRKIYFVISTLFFASTKKNSDNFVNKKIMALNENFLDDQIFTGHYIFLTGLEHRKTDFLFSCLHNVAILATVLRTKDPVSMEKVLQNSDK